MVPFHRLGIWSGALDFAQADAFGLILSQLTMGFAWPTRHFLSRGRNNALASDQRLVGKGPDSFTTLPDEARVNGSIVAN